MKNLTIKDLNRAAELDHDAMAAVCGGHGRSQAPWLPAPHVSKSLDATQSLGQFQNVVNATADGSAFVDRVNATNTTSQFGQNNILAG